MTLRRMKEADVPAAARLEKEIFADPWGEEDISETALSPIGIAFFAEEDGRPAGYLVGRAVPPEAEVLRVAVTPAYRRRGIGKALLGAFFDEAGAREATDAYLEVRSKNAGAIALYTAAGFTPSGRRKDYYKNPTDDAVLMTVSRRDERKTK